MPLLPLKGADLSFETLGTGPLLLLIAGADGRGAVWKSLAEQLRTRYTVVMYDRRGYSRSIITSAQDYSQRLTIDANDAASLIKHLSPEEGVTVIGNSSGAIVGLNLLLRHPETVRKFVCHEPPAFGALDSQHRPLGEQAVHHIYAVYRAKGPIAAMEEFTTGLAVGDEGPLMRSLMHPAHSDEVRANAQFWFEFELRQYPCSDVDVEGLVALEEKIVPAAGVVSRGSFGVAPIASIAGAVAKEVWELPGGHLGFISEAKSWAEAFLEGIGGR